MGDVSSSCSRCAHNGPEVDDSGGKSEAVQNVLVVQELQSSCQARAEGREASLEDGLHLDTEEVAADAALPPSANTEEVLAVKERSTRADIPEAAISDVFVKPMPSLADAESRRVAHEAEVELLQSSLLKTKELRGMSFKEEGAANRYDRTVAWPPFVSGQHVPVLALLNPLSGAGAGRDILKIAGLAPYYQERFFSILDVVKGQQVGGMMDIFRIELNKAKEEAKAMGCRPRLISGGGDGTASFALSIMFTALRAGHSNSLLGFADSGNGFVWSDEELADFFPALAQMPLGSANDCAHILGWGQKYPGDRGHLGCMVSRQDSAQKLASWIGAAINRASKTANFDVWGILPRPGDQAVDFLLAELTGPRGRCPNDRREGTRHVRLKQAGKPTPFFVCLYFSSGFGAYMTARFQINRRGTPIKNRAEYIRQALGIVLESTPPQLPLRLDGVEIDCEEKPYFPPRRDKGQRGSKYREVGFYNINWQANALHGADRASVSERLLSERRPARFDDGLMDMFRWNLKSILKNPGLRIQTDKRKDMLLEFNGGKGKGLFFQWDGEARYVFRPDDKPFHIYCRQVLKIPVVLGPQWDARCTGPISTDQGVGFKFVGDTPEAVAQVKRRIIQMVDGELDDEMLASKDVCAAFGV